MLLLRLALRNNQKVEDPPPPTTWCGFEIRCRWSEGGGGCWVQVSEEASGGSTSRIHQDPLGSSRIRQDPPSSSRIHQDPLGSTRIHQDPLGSSRIHQDPLGCARIHQDPLGWARIHQVSSAETRLSVLSMFFSEITISGLEDTRSWIKPRGSWSSDLLTSN